MRVKQIREFIARFFIKRFDAGLNVALKRANRLHMDKGQTVVCIYCGGLLRKSEAGVEYDMENDQVTYCHERCFDRCAPHGTAEDLERAAMKEDAHESHA